MKVRNHELVTGTRVGASARPEENAVRGAEAERQRLREALHDGLGQLLTSISFLAGSLRQKLAARQLPEASQAAEILTLTGQAISETQTLVKENGLERRMQP